MKRLLAAFTVVAALGLVPSSALAGPIVIDPIIGVRGGDVGSTASNNSDFAAMAGGSCGVDLVEHFGAGNVFCESFFIVDPTPPPFSESSYVPPFNVYSVTLRFSDASGGIVNTALFADSDPDRNEFGGFSRSVADSYAVTLTIPSEGSLSCGINSPSAESHTTCFQVYLAIPQNETVNGPYGVSLTAINGIQQDPTLAPVPTPEPGTLALLGLGLAGVAGRRLRRKSA